MTKIPENIQDNPLLEGIQQIMYDDTPENIAKGLNVISLSRIQAISCCRNTSQMPRTPISLKRQSGLTVMV